MQIFLGRRIPLPNEPDVVALWVEDDYRHLPAKGLAFINMPWNIMTLTGFSSATTIPIWRLTAWKASATAAMTLWATCPWRTEGSPAAARAT